MDFPLFRNNCHWIQLSWHQKIYSVRAWSAIWNGNACSFYTCETKKNRIHYVLAVRICVCVRVRVHVCHSIFTKLRKSIGWELSLRRYWPIKHPLFFSMILKRKKERKTERTRKISRLLINHLLKQIRKKRVSLQIVLFRNFMQSICMQSAVCVWRVLWKIHLPLNDKHKMRITNHL